MTTTMTTQDLAAAWPALASLGLPVWEADLEGRVVRCNAVAVPECGDPVGRLLTEFVQPGDREAVADGIAALCAGLRRRVTLRCTLADDLGARHVAATGVVVVADDGSVTGLVLVSTDVTPEHRGSQRWASLIEHTSDPIMVLDRDRRLLYRSRSLEDLIGHDGPLRPRVHPDDLPEMDRAFAEVAAEPGRTARVESRVRHADGSWRVVEAHAVNRLDEPSVAGIIVSTRDVTDRRAAEAELRRAAHTDPVTGYPNWRAVAEDMATRWRDPSRGRPILTVLTIDRWPTIVASIGQALASQLLCDVGSRLRPLLAEDGVLGHLGREAFVMLADDVDVAAAADRAAAILEALKTPLVLDGRKVHLGMSIGIAAAHDGDDDVDVVLRRAEAAVASAASRGGGTAVVADVGAHQRAAARLDLELALAVAVAEGGIEVHYQPQVDALTGRICGFEALARWTHPLLGPISPHEFIPIAERSGLIHELGEHILRTACTVQASVAPLLDGASSISVNVSARQLADERFPAIVVDALTTSGLDAEALCLEVTETVLVEDAEAAARALAALRAIGVRISVDDFGTGHSSLAQIRRFPIDELKIDRTFVEELRPGSPDVELVRAVIEMARSLDIRVVAEGVEHLHQLEVLAALGCARAQGWFWSAPVPAARLAATIPRVHSLGDDVAPGLRAAAGEAAEAAAPMAGLAHELKNLTTIIRTALSMVGDDDLEEDQATLVAAARRAADSMDVTVRAALPGKGVAPAPAPVEEPVDLGAMAAEVVQELSPVLVEKRVRLTRPHTGPVVEGDRHGLRRILVNLLTNAGKYAPRATAVTVEVASEGGDAVIVVTDEGSGVPEADRDRIFERAHRATADAEGHGLGLFLARRTARDHGGDLRYRESPTGGASFVLSLPARTVGRGDASGPRDHAVVLYDAPGEADARIADVVTGALAAGEVVVVVARPARLSELTELPDVADAVAAGRVRLLDAERTLDELLIDGRVDGDRFDEVVAPFVRDVVAVGPTRVYGEMVDLLCERGRAREALVLEGLWNALREQVSFALVCGYEVRTLDPSDREPVRAAHGHRLVSPRNRRGRG